VRSLMAALVAALVLLPAAPAWAAGQPPVAVDDAVTYRNTGGLDYLVNALANDGDPDGDTLTYTAVTPASKGNAYLSAGKLYYKPFFGNTGTDSFTYTVSDGQGNTASATVTATLWVDLAAPSGLTMNSGDATSATISWPAAAGAVQYQVLRNTVLVATTSSLTWTDTGLLSDRQYTYRVASVNGGGFGGSPSSAAVFRQPQKWTPVGLAVDLTDDPTTLALTWSSSESGPWDVYRDGAPVASSSTRSFTDTGLVTGQEYSYQVQTRGYSTSMEVTPASALSAAVRATPGVLTDIGRLFRDLGSSGGVLGPITVAERAITGGRQQDHQNGLILQQDGEEPFSVSGNFATAYTSLGGAAGELGFPLMQVDCGLRDSGCAQFFEGGSIWASYVPTVVVPLVIEDGWGAVGWEEGPLGYPVDDVVDLGDGVVQDFEGGAVYYTDATGSHGVSLDIWDRYAAGGAEDGWLGYPTSDEFELTGGTAQTFQRGTVYWSAGGGAHTVHGAVRSAWIARGAENGWLGFPTSDEIALVGGVTQTFQRGTVYWSAAGGAHTVHGAIRTAWNARGSETGWLGYPTSDEIALNGGVTQTFQRGTMYWSAAGGAHTVHGAIRSAWNARGAENGWLGYPTSDEIALNGGVAQVFQRGTMYWSAAGGAHTVHGAIRTAWNARGAEVGWLGYPTSDEIALRGGVAQVFQRGSMYWSVAGGAHTVHGAIRNAWAAQGAETGRLGYPTSDEIPLNGGSGQIFQGGTITYYPTTGRTAVAFKR
jgi:uncharacterized protein with LGFP repeats